MKNKTKGLLAGIILGISAAGLTACGNVTVGSESGQVEPAEKEKYVTFKVQDESGKWKDLTSRVLITDGKVTIPEAPKKNYYTFRGWFLDTNWNEEFKNEDLKQSVTVYAYYIADEVNIVINGESQGTRDLADVVNGTYNPGENLTFDGWYTNPECTVKFNPSDPAKTLYAQSVATITFDNGYEEIYSVNVKPGSVYADPRTTKAQDEDGTELDETIEAKYIVKTYMSSEDIFYVDEDGNDIDFSKGITQNTTIKVLWKSPFLGYMKSPNSEDLFCCGNNYGSQDYYASDRSKVSADGVPVVSIPSRITVTDKDGNKSIKNVVAAYIQETTIFNSTNLKKIIVNEGIGYIRGFNSDSGASSVELIELPSTLKIISDCFNNITGLTKDTVKIPDSVEAIYDSFWNKCSGDYNSTIFYSGVPYDFDIEIPDSVKSLSIVPNNFKFSATSSFVNDGTMIYQNTEKGKVLVHYDQIESGVMNVPEGVNGIQVGAFVNMQELKTLVLPSTFSFINYNLNLNDYKNIYVWNQSDYTNYECYLYTTDLNDNDFAYNGRMIVSTLQNMDYVVFNSLNISDDVYRAIGGDTTGWSRLNGTFTYADNEVYKDIKVVNVSPTETPTVKVSLTNTFTDEKYSVAIPRTNSNAITLDEILTAIDNEYNSSLLALKNASHLSASSIAQFGKTYDLNQTITNNRYLDIDCELTNYQGFTYEALGNEITITGFNQSTAVDLGGNTYGVIIPNEIDGKKVTKIAADAFKDNGLIKNVKLGANIKEIGDNTFLDCANLVKIDFNGALLETIGAHAFEGTSLSSLSFSVKNLKNVGAYAFKIETLAEFIPVNGDEERNATNIADGEFYFLPEQLINASQTATYTGYVALLKRISKTTTEDKNIYDVALYAYAVKNNSSNVNIGNVDDNNIIRVELLEGSISYTTSDNRIYLYSVSKIHTNAFTDCVTGSRKIYYSPTGLGITTSVSKVSDLVDALPNVFEENWINNYETVAAYKVRTC